MNIVSPPKIQKKFSASDVMMNDIDDWDADN